MNFQQHKRAILFFSSLFLFFIFICFSYLVHKDVFTQFDFDMTVRLQDNISRRFDNVFSSLSLAGSFELTLVLFIAIIIAGYKKKRRLLLLIWFPLFHVVEIAAKTLLEHPGPPYLFLRYRFDFHFPTTYLSSDFFSYPSGHVGRTAFLVGMFLLLTLFSKWNIFRKIVVSAVLIGILGLMMVSRVYLGEHWTSDVIGGALLGFSFALSAMAVW